LLSNSSGFPPIGQSFTVLTTVDSTNNYAMQAAKSGLGSHGSVYFALEQSAGRGQRGRSWQSQPGENIALSAILEPHQLHASQAFVLSACIALACYDFFKNYTGPDELRIKWPNDLYWQDRKAAGILIENIYRGNQWSFAIAGIGININQTRFDLPSKKAVSLKQITGRYFDLMILCRELCSCLEERYRQLMEDENEILHAYNEVLYKKEQVVQLQLQKDGSIRELTVLRAEPDGRLLCSDHAGQSFYFSSGEIVWLAF
jgi:BirA family biotin operon repressor/biotin-[acetyl-CoA-carboxylase] ligase